MTLKIELSNELENKLETKAKSIGIDTKEFIKLALEEKLDFSSTEKVSLPINNNNQPQFASGGVW